MLSYQGRLTDSLGNPVPDGNYQLTFRLYQQETGGTPFWTEAQTIMVRNGLFSALLGAVTPITSLPDAGTVWLSLQVGIAPELTPRLRIVSAAYSFLSEKAQTLDQNGAGVGQVLKWNGTAWAAANDEFDNNAWVRGTPESVLYTIRRLGIARGGANNMLWGNNRFTHVNLGVTCTTGTNGQNYAYCTVAGGSRITASGYYATVPGGYANIARGYASFAAGRYARANHNGSFVWSDSAVSASESVYTTGNDQFRVRARGGTWFFSNAGMTTGVVLASGSNSWASACDSTNKTDFAPVDKKELLRRVAELRVRYYRMKDQTDGTRHLGPVAQDFKNAFGVGESDKTINMADADGVLFAAIQALYEELQQEKEHSQQLMHRIELLEKELQRRK